MDKIFDAFLAVAIAIFLVETVPVMACSGNVQGITGAACSISDINNRLKYKNPESEKQVINEQQKNNLRPVVLIPTPLDEEDFLNDDCPVGACLLKKLLK